MNFPKETIEGEKAIIALSNLCNVSNDYIKKHKKVTDSEIKMITEETSSPLIDFYKEEVEKGEQYKFRNAIHLYISRPLYPLRPSGHWIIPNKNLSTGGYVGETDFINQFTKKEIISPRTRKLIRRLKLSDIISSNYKRCILEGENGLIHDVIGLKPMTPSEIIEPIMQKNLEQVYHWMGESNGENMLAILDEMYQKSEYPIKWDFRTMPLLVKGPRYPYRNMSTEKIIELTNSAFETLDDKEKDILSRFYGLNKEKETLGNIGKDYNVCSERVRHIKERAMSKIIGEIERKKGYGISTNKKTIGEKV